jgi:hypothetical protein
MGSKDAAPPDVFQQAATYQLGTQLQTYKPRYSPMAAVGIAAGVIILDIIVQIALLAAIDRFSIYLIILPIVMIIFAVRSIMVGNTKIYIFTNGLIQAKGQQRDVIRWDQVEAVWTKVTRVRYYYFYSRMTYKYTVRRTDGASFTFGSPLKDIATLGTTLEQEVARLHTPRAIEAFNSGAPVVFGSLTVGIPGISNGRETLPWNMVKSISVNRGIVSVHKEGQMLRWASANVSNIPNFQVFVNVTNHALRSVGKAVQFS